MDKWFVSLLFDGMGWYVFLTCLCAAFLAGCIGLERELKGLPAGLRTHVIVSISCCLLMSVSLFGVKKISENFPEFSTLTFDATRIAAGILSGIGFMGAGTIIKTGLNVRGLTTASTIFFSAAIGMACGCAFVLEALIATALSLFFMVSLSCLEKMLDKRCPTITLFSKSSFDVSAEIKREADNNDLIIKSINSSFHGEKEDAFNSYVVVVFAYQTSMKDLKKLSDLLSQFGEVRDVKLTCKGK